MRKKNLYFFPQKLKTSPIIKIEFILKGVQPKKALALLPALAPVQFPGPGEVNEFRTAFHFLEKSTSSFKKVLGDRYAAKQHTNNHCEIN
jgi:hypothetical protein